MADDTSLHLSDPLPEPRRYQSKVDAWLALLLVAVAVAVCIGMLTSDVNPWVKLLAFAPQGLIFWTLARTYYVITDVALEIRSGPFRWSVPFGSIRSLSGSRNPLSAPALSIDRIAVGHTRGTVLISPRHKAAFVHAMVLAVPGLEVTDLPGADGRVPTEEESAFNLSGILPAVIVMLLALAFGGWSLYSGLREPVVTLTPGALTVDAYYEESVRRSEVVRIHLEDAFPAATRRQGFAAMNHLRGTFEVEGVGLARVFVNTNQPPFIVLDTTSRPVVLNFSDPARTRALYDELLDTWGLRRSGTQP